MSEKGEKASWLEPLPEEYTTEEGSTGRRMLIAGATVVVLAVFGGLVWYSYLEGSDKGPVPVVRADRSVVKEKPDTPGGLKVLDQDKRVFNRLASGAADNSDQLAPSGELPLDRPVEAPKATDDILAQAEEAIKQSVVLSQKLSAATGGARKPAVPESKAPSKGAEKPVVEAVEKPAPKSVVKPSVKKTVAKDVKIGNFLIQLGAFGKKDTAMRLWKQIQKDNMTLLDGLSSDIMMIDLGKKGVLYRLRGGMIGDRASADKICAGLKAKKQACIVVAK